jgi:hypothetical protein
MGNRLKVERENIDFYVELDGKAIAATQSKVRAEALLVAFGLLNQPPTRQEYEMITQAALRAVAGQNWGAGATYQLASGGEVEPFVFADWAAMDSELEDDEFAEQSIALDALAISRLDVGASFDLHHDTKFEPYIVTRLS